MLYGGKLLDVGVFLLWTQGLLLRLMTPIMCFRGLLQHRNVSIQTMTGMVEEENVAQSLNRQGISETVLLAENESSVFSAV